MESLMSQYRKLHEQKDYINAYTIAQKLYKKEENEENRRLLAQAEDNMVISKEIQQIIKSDHDDYYKILDVAEDATLEIIKKAFRKKVSRYHPNRTSVDGAAAATRIIQRAYFDINTETKIAEYNAKRKHHAFKKKQHSNPFSEPPSGSFNDHFYYMRRENGGIFSNFNSFNDVYQEFENLERGRYHYVDYNTILSELYRQANQQRRNQQPFTFFAYFAYILLFLLIILMCL